MKRYVAVVQHNEVRMIGEPVNGEWVRYEDALAIQKKLDEAIKLIRALEHASCDGCNRLEKDDDGHVAQLYCPDCGGRFRWTDDGGKTPVEHLDGCIVGTFLATLDSKDASDG